MKFADKAPGFHFRVKGFTMKSAITYITFISWFLSNSAVRTVVDKASKDL